MELLTHLIPETSAALAQLNFVLAVIHTGLILFVMFGAFFKKLVPFHFPVLVLVWISWLGIGWYVKHMGYCILTDFHWQVKTRMGESDLPSSYITYLYRDIFGSLPNAIFIHYATGGVMLLVTVVSLTRYVKWWRSSLK